MSRSNSLSTLLHLLQLSDSALPIGGFTFSNTLESAIDSGTVGDERSLEEYIGVAIEQTATLDGVVAREAMRAYHSADFGRIVDLDHFLLAHKINTEQRTMSLRMGRKMCDLAASITSDSTTARLGAEIAALNTPGTLAVVQGVVAASVGTTEQELFVSMIYGTASMMLSAALRTMRTTHIQTQRILYHIGERIDSLYDVAKHLSLDECYTFSPLLDLHSAQHERSQKRLFMN